jgi:perosamine synthetase
MASTSFAVIHAGAIPVFADINKETLTIDPISVEQKITKKTKAIMPVSLYGLAPDMDPIMKLAQKHNLCVIEDDAQCFLGGYKGKKVGSIGHMSSFSFQNSKHMTCGEGGMVTTNDLQFAEELRRFSSLGYGLVSAKPGQSKIDKKSLVKPTFKRHVSLGYNYRLSEICSAVLMAQFERLDEFVDWRRQTAKAFDAVLRSNCTWLHPQCVPAGYEHSYWAYTVVIDKSLSLDFWEKFYEKFIELGGEGFYGAWSLTYLEPVFQSGVFGEYTLGICPNAEFVQPRIMQFKTNYGSHEHLKQQCDALEKTIRFFN